MMLMSSGVNFGFRRTLPHLLGVVLGFSLMVVLIGSGLDAIFTWFPRLLPIMRWAGSPICRGSPGGSRIRDRCGRAKAQGRPLGFFGAAAFQWINPKAWAIAVSALTAYSVSDDYAVSVAAVAFGYLAIGMPSSGAWVLFGAAMRKALSDPRRVRPFNLTMAALLVASIVPALFE